MSTAVAELEFLSRSKHRLHVLRALREPCDRSTLRERTDASKPTLSRALGEFEERQWVTRERSEYRLTALGSVVVDGVDAALRALETAEKLTPLATWLPFEEFGFEVGRLHDATVRTETQGDSLGVLRRLGTLLYDAETVYQLTGVVATSGIDTHRRAIEDHGQTLHVVLTADALVTIRSDPDMRSLAGTVQAADGVSVYRYDGTVPYFLAVTEDRVVLAATDDSGSIRGLVESTDSTVRGWALDRWEAYRDASVAAAPISS